MFGVHRFSQTPARCRSYSGVTQLLEETLRSVCRQTKVRLSCDSCFKRNSKYSALRTFFVEVDFPPPPIPRVQSRRNILIFIWIRDVSRQLDF